jgi:hypothetical protein
VTSPNSAPDGVAQTGAMAVASMPVLSYPIN